MAGRLHRDRALGAPRRRWPGAPGPHVPNAAATDQLVVPVGEVGLHGGVVAGDTGRDRHRDGVDEIVEVPHQHDLVARVGPGARVLDLELPAPRPVRRVEACPGLLLVGDLSSRRPRPRRACPRPRRPAERGRPVRRCRVRREPRRWPQDACRATRAPLGVTAAVHVDPLPRTRTRPLRWSERAEMRRAPSPSSPLDGRPSTIQRSTAICTADSAAGFLPIVPSRPARCPWALLL